MSTHSGGVGSFTVVACNISCN